MDRGVYKLIAVGYLNPVSLQEQCRREMFAGRVFRYIREAPITFHPTYKFDKHTSTYDTSEKQRVPAWTDRIFFRGSAFIKNVPEVAHFCCIQWLPSS